MGTNSLALAVNESTTTFSLRRTTKIYVLLFCTLAHRPPRMKSESETLSLSLVCLLNHTLTLVRGAKLFSPTSFRSCSLEVVRVASAPSGPFHILNSSGCKQSASQCQKPPRWGPNRVPSVFCARRNPSLKAAGTMKPRWNLVVSVWKLIICFILRENSCEKVNTFEHGWWNCRKSLKIIQMHVHYAIWWNPQRFALLINMRTLKTWTDERKVTTVWVGKEVWLWW